MTLGDVAKWGSGGTPKATNPAYYGGSIPWAVIGDLADGVVVDTAKTITDDGLAESSAKLVAEGTLLIAMYGSIGKLGIAGRTMATNQAIAFAYPDESVLTAKFLFWYLRSQRAELNAGGKGATQSNISQTVLKGWPIPVPPLDEQRRIVDAIETHLSHLDAGVESLQRAKRNLERMRKAVRETAASGGFTHSPKVRESWPVRKLGQLIERIETGKSVRAHPRPARIEEWGVIKVSAMTWGEFDEEENKAIPLGITVNPVHEIHAGDLLLSRANTSEYVGATVIAGSPRPRLLLSDKSMRLVTVDGIHKPWLQMVLASPGLRSQMSAVATGTSDSMRNISQAKVRNLDLVVPPLDAQVEIVDDADSRLERVSVALGEVATASVRAAALRWAVLARAFSGNLVRSVEVRL